METDGPQGRHPTGAQVAIRCGDQLAWLTEVGAGLRAYTVAGRPLLDGYGEEEPCTGGRGQTLIPWPNRIRGGQYTWQGRAQQLDLTEPARLNAIHGLTRWANWRVLEQRASDVRFGHVLHPHPGWPFILGCELHYALDAGGLTVRTTVTNLGREACPYGTGAHPYLTVGTRTVDEVRVRVPASRHLPSDEHGIPRGLEPVEGSPWDFREARRIGAQTIDLTFTELERDGDGRARIFLQAESGLRLALWLGEGYDFLQLYTGDKAPELERRRRGLAVEPMTCAPDAFNSGDGLRVLEPGASHTAQWGIEPHPAAST